MTPKLTILDILKDPATYRKAWVGFAVPFIAGLIGFYVPDNQLTLAEFLSVLGVSLGTGGTVFAAPNGEPKTS